MLRLALVVILAGAGTASAGGLVAARTLPAGTVLTAADLILGEADQGEASPSAVIGRQTRLTIYEGRPILAAQLQAPKLVSRNQVVRLAFRQGPLSIEIEGRALAEGAAGDVIRVMNIASRSTVSARVNTDGTLTVAE